MPAPPAPTAGRIVAAALALIVASTAPRGPAPAGVDAAGRPAGPAARTMPLDAAPALRFTPIGRVGGAVTGLAFDGARLVVSRGERVLAYDATDPRAPAPLGAGVGFAGRVRVVAAAGGRAYVLETVRRAPDDDGPRRDVVLHVLALDGPDGARTLGSVALGVAAAGGLALDGSRGWLAAGADGLLALDLADGSAPRRLAAYEVGGMAVDAAWVTPRLVVARAARRGGETDGLLVLDASTTPPTERASVPLPGAPRALAAPPGGEWLVAGGDFGLVRIAAADPPLVVAADLPAAPILALAASAERVLAVAAGARWGWTLLVLEPVGPASLAVDERIRFPTSLGPPTLAAAGEVVAVGEAERGVTVLAPAGTDRVVTARLPTLGAPGGLVAEGARLWAGDADGELWPIEGLGAAAPRAGPPVDAGPHLPGGAGCGCVLGALARDGRTGRVHAAHSSGPIDDGGLVTFDLRAPGGPTVSVWAPREDPLLVDRHVGPETWWITSGDRLQLRGGRAWLAGVPWLTALALPVDGPVRLAAYAEAAADASPSEGLAVAAAPDGAAAWVATDAGELRRLAPSAADPVAWVGGPVAPTDGAVRDLLWEGDVLYAADDRAGLVVRDARDGRVLATVDGVVAERLAGDPASGLLYVSGVGQDADTGMKTHEIAVVDVRAPARPRLLGRTLLAWRQEYTDFHAAPAVAVVGAVLAVTDGDLGVSFLRVSGLPAAAGGALHLPVARR